MGSLVEVHWVDAESHDPWLDKDELAAYIKSPLPYCRTVGFLARLDSDVIVVMCSKHRQGGCGVFRIPTQMAKKITPLKRIPLEED